VRHHKLIVVRLGGLMVGQPQPYWRGSGGFAEALSGVLPGRWAPASRGTISGNGVSRSLSDTGDADGASSNLESFSSRDKSTALRRPPHFGAPRQQSRDAIAVILSADRFTIAIVAVSVVSLCSTAFVPLPHQKTTERCQTSSSRRNCEATMQMYVLQTSLYSFYLG
jgi:hypothetical protein